MQLLDKQALRSLLPDEDRLRFDDIPPHYLTDALDRVHGQADALAFPLTTEEVSALLRYAHDHDIPVTPRGAGTNLVGSTIPTKGGIVLDLSRMDRVLELDRDTMTITVEPGMLLQNLQAYVEERGLFYPPDPGEKAASIGGNISTNAGGMRAVKYGVTRDYVRGLTAVLADGTVLELGEAYSGSKYPRPDAGSYLLLTFDGRALEVQANLECVKELVLSQGALEVIPLDDAAQAAEIWRVRGALVKAAEAVSEQEPMDIVVPISKTAEFIRFIHALEAKSGVRMIGFGHAGDGNVHLCVMRDGRDQETWDKLLHETAEQAYEEAYRLGGVASGEHGIGLSKRSYFLRQTQPEVLTAMNQIKNALDPKHILNDQKSYVKGETNHATTV